MPAKAKPTAAPKVSRFAQLVAEAKKEYKAPEPYIFDAFDPPVEITAPDTLERSLALATLLDVRGNVSAENLRPMLRALVGDDAFGVVWDAVCDEPVEVAFALVEDINDHFTGGALDGTEPLPGGLQGS